MRPGTGRWSPVRPRRAGRRWTTSPRVVARSPRLRRPGGGRLSRWSDRLRPPGGLVDGEEDPEAGVAGRRLDANVAVVTAYDDAVADVESEAGAPADVLGGEERLEDARPQLGRDARAGVANLDDDAVLVPG